MVKFRDDGRVRVQNGALVSEAKADLRRVRSLVTTERLQLASSIEWPTARTDALLARAQARSGRSQPDLAGLIEVTPPAGTTPSELERIGESLQALPIVEAAWIETLGVPPPREPTPHLGDRQDYRQPNPGLDLLAGWNMQLTGAGLRIADVEYGWNHDHEQFKEISLNPEPNQVPVVGNDPWWNHGTAVVGVTSAPANGFGITGAVPDAYVHVYPELTVQGGFRRTQAVLAAIEASQPGDVVMLELQTGGVDGNYVPGEFEPSVWMATRVGADAGVVVVAAAGNGDVDLDGPDYAAYRERGDSGAIIVGAGSGTTSRAKLQFSTHGARVDVQGWGQNVFTAGYGNYAIYGDDMNRSYTAQFNGTSSATPLVASACVALQQLAKEGVIPKPATRGQYDIIPSVVAYIRHLRAVASGDGGNLLTEKTRLARAQAEKTEVEIARLKGVLVPAAQVERAWASMIAAARAKLLTLPVRATPLVLPLSEESAIERLLTDMVMEALSELAEAALDDDPDLANPGALAVATTTDDDGEPMG
mgnify:CR=1 FL=1